MLRIMAYGKKSGFTIAVALKPYERTVIDMGYSIVDKIKKNCEIDLTDIYQKHCVVPIYDGIRGGLKGKEREEQFDDLGKRLDSLENLSRMDILGRYDLYVRHEARSVI
ncbi:hypothetical protein ACFL03_06490 [Thermodesulfobacteriota bacterium]